VLLKMGDNLDPDVHALKEWLRGAWCQLADPNLTRFEQRELRNYMKDVERALRAGLRQLAARDLARRHVESVNPAPKRVDFRLLRLDA
jgi:DNA-binding HxlR family transcriptional regulator